MKYIIKNIFNKFGKDKFYYLNKLAEDLVNPEDRNIISPLEKRVSPLYRVGKKSRLESYLSEGIRMKKGSSDLGDLYLDESGSPQLRGYFFSDKNSVMISIMSSDKDKEAIIGNVSSDDEVVILEVDPKKICEHNSDHNLFLYEDQELKFSKTGLNSVYIASNDSDSKWEIPASSIISHKSLDEYFEEEESEDFYSEDIDEDYY